MRNLTIKNLFIARSGDRCLIVFLAVLAMLCSVDIYGASNVPDNGKNIFYLHSWFSTRHWKQSGDTLDYVIDSSVTALKPLTAYKTGNDTDNVFIVNTVDHKSWIFRAVITRPLSVIGKWSLNCGKPVEYTGAPFNSTTICMAMSGNSLENVFVASPLGKTKVAVSIVVTANGNIQKTDTLSIASSDTTASITKLYGGSEYGLGSTSSLWVLGSSGIIRLFKWDGSVWSKETVYDIPATETLSAFNGKYAGTTTGKIYLWGLNKFTYMAQPGTSRITSFANRGACGTNGSIEYVKGSTWKHFTIGNSLFMYGNFIPRTDGIGIETLDSAWNYSIQTLEDTQTDMIVSPQKFANAINKNPINIQLSQFPETLTIKLTDVEGNFKLPSIVMGKTNMLDNGKFILSDMHPDTVCAPNINELADSIITIIMSKTEVKLSVLGRSSQFNLANSRYFWKSTQFNKSELWKTTVPSDTFTVSIPGKYLKVINSITVTELTTAQKGVPVLEYCKYADGRVMTKFAKNSLQSISVYTMLGKKVFEHSVPDNADYFVLPVSELVSSVYIFEFMTRDKKSLRSPLFLLK